MKVFKKILNTIINILIVLVLLTSILIAVMALSSKSSGISTIFGYTIQTIQSDSMVGGSPDGYEGGDFASGDIIIAKATGFTNDGVYEIGDIVTYTAETTDGGTALIVHRIVDAVDRDGIDVYQTWGDNRAVSEVPDQDSVEEYLTPSQIGSVFYSADYHGKIIRGLGGALDFIKSQTGFFLVVLLPMIIFFLYEMIRVVLNASNYRKARTDEEKQAAVDEALAAAGASAASPGMSAEELEQFRQFQAFRKMQQQQQAKSDAQSETPSEPQPAEPAESRPVSRYEQYKAQQEAAESQPAPEPAEPADEFPAAPAADNSVEE